MLSRELNTLQITVLRTPNFTCKELHFTDAESGAKNHANRPEYNINAKQREFAGHTGRVFDVDLAEDGLCVTASGGRHGQGLAPGGRPPRGPISAVRIKGRGATRRVGAKSSEEASGASMLAVAGADGFCNLWRGDDWSAPKSLQRLDHGGDQVYGCAWSACGDAYGAWLLTAAGAAVRTWDVNAGKSIKQWSYQELRGDQAYVFDVQPAPRDADDALKATIACAVSDGTRARPRRPPTTTRGSCGRPAIRR